MKLLTLILISLSLVSAQERTELTGPEKLSFLNLVAEATDAIVAANAAQAKAQNLNEKIQKKADELKEAHKAYGCDLGAGLNWNNCSAEKAQAEAKAKLEGKKK